ncbi:hypothetical protein GCM10029976_052270 [Kribbella albertanoniae]|uniref:Uncharacterized protein n=1 Tax=Kribbella albertanoniae TaxID=1266829 RepID=A0A4V2XRM4_9ACTN|nr:hypothetical protein [Kribbella albertanoniae]TDC30465.1 hypothetical protein E1261_13350 [Kribbella albertanoniae]
MIEFEYTTTDPSVLPGWERQHDVAAASRADLLWSAFPGDLALVTPAAEIRTSFAWVPLLHFALSMVTVVDELTTPGAKAHYGFTESDDELDFERSRELVRVGATFSDVVLSTTVPDLSRAVRVFAGDLLDDLTRQYPALGRHEVVVDLRSQLARRTA